ncbi:MAG TPA: rod shape-determining protein MreC [Planktothrix sp.]
MNSSGQRNLPFNPEAAAEFIFLLMVIWLMAGPVSGVVLNVQAWFSSVFAKGATQVESTKNLANQVLDASKRIKQLEARLAKTQLELVTLQQQTRESNRLRALLGLKDKKEPQAIAAEIIARDPDNWFEQAVLDKGKDDGVKVSAGVITADGVVGQVVKVDDHASVVRLLTDPDEKIGVMMQHTGITGILSGKYDKPARIDYVPVGTNVDIGDKVLCLAKGTIFPKNHPVGVVTQVNRENNGAALSIDVKLSENCYDLSEVLILPPQE